jgi:hypothetical protein
LRGLPNSIVAMLAPISARPFEPVPAPLTSTSTDSPSRTKAAYRPDRPGAA